MTDKYAVIGNPVAHSKSPLIHAEFARQTGQEISYTTIFAPLDGFRNAVFDFRDKGGRGANVTLPFKREAWQLVDSHAGYALDANAVNTIEFIDGRMMGHNTDGTGLVRDIRDNLKFPMQGKRVLLMGAGGATYGALHPLLGEHPDRLVVANRTLDKAISLVAHFRKFWNFASGGVAAQSYPQLAGSQFDLVINATSAGLSDAMPRLPDSVFAPGALAYDMMYGRVTPFMRFASGKAAVVSDGLGMLVEQAAESFFIWRGARPRTAPVIEMLKKSVSGEQ
jgi:shikimate dehydrogenase